ncbi:MAG: SDR family oxidoreductase [Saprospirales bacterium]|nr:SDR family oxidoreductase [Saprospirales bacterium]
MTKLKWTSNDIANQHNRVVIITGATSGLGKEATKILAEKNATVIMAVRNTQKGEKVAGEIKKSVPEAKIEVRKLDLGSLSSVKSLSEQILAGYNRLDILINNAGVMMCPFSKTEDGFEIQMGTNHLGHFALTGLLMPLLKETKGARIVATSSIAHRTGNIDFEDINWGKRKYNTTQAYADSKLANLYFAYELARKLKNDPNAPVVTAAHPGYTSTDLQRHNLFWRIMNPILGQKIEQGTLPTLRAAADLEAKAGDFYGPSGFLEMAGAPVVVKSTKMAYNEVNAKRLWEVSEKMTGIQF